MKVKKSLKLNPLKIKPVSEYKTKTNDKGQTIMICQNSKPGGKYWKGKDCLNWSVVNSDVSSVLCFECTAVLADPPYIRVAAAKSDKPKGWKFMKEFVTADGTVYHKGIEQPSLKGTLPVTVIEPKQEKKKLSKQEKEDAMQSLGKEIESLKGKIMHETRKGKKAELTRSLTKANRQFKKLM